MSEEHRKISIALPVTGEDEWQAVRESLISGWLSQGPKVAEFENKFAERHKVKYAAAVTSGTTALHVILAAMEIEPGDEVIVPSFTWVATANVVLYCGATPVFVDVDRTTFNIDPVQVATKITPRTRAIIAVHQFGLCADIDSLRKVVQDIPIIEDAACAAGSEYNGKPAGSLGIAAAFSFHPRKSITTGEGGMVTTNDGMLADKVLMLRNHGATLSNEQRRKGSRPYLLPDFNILGFNYRMTDIQGAIGLVQLSQLDQFIDQRHRMVQVYMDQLSDIPWLTLPTIPEGYRHSWQSFVCFVHEEESPMSRNELMDYLQKKGISTRPGTHAIHTLNYYKERFGFKSSDFPVAYDCDQFSMAIPLHNRMIKEDIEYMMKILKEVG